MIFVINGRLNDEVVKNFADFLNTSFKDSENKAHIYLRSEGGSVQSMEQILHMINVHQNDLYLVGSGILASAAFELFFSAPCEKTLVGVTCGMYHMSTVDVTLNEQNKPAFFEDEGRKLWLRDALKKTRQFMKFMQFDEKSTKKVLKGDDVWFSDTQMRNFLASSLDTQNKVISLSLIK